METLGLFSATLGLSPPWRITLVSFARQERRLDIGVAFESAVPLSCPLCGQSVTPGPRVKELWYHHDFLHYPTYLSAEIPRLQCACGRELAVERPWTRTGSKFGLLH